MRPMVADGWDSSARRRPGRPRTSSREQALEVALDLVGREGFAALNLRRLASEVGVSVASVHNLFGGKDALLDELVDLLVAKIDVPERGTPRERLRVFAEEQRSVLFDYNGLAGLILERGAAGPNAVQLADRVLGTLAEAGVPDDCLLDAYHSLLVYVNGFVLAATTATRQSARRVATAARTHIDSLPAGAVPHLRTAARRPPRSQQGRFALGLGAMLTGLLGAEPTDQAGQAEARHPSRSPGRK